MVSYESLIRAVKERNFSKISAIPPNNNSTVFNRQRVDFKGQSLRVNKVRFSAEGLESYRLGIRAKIASLMTDYKFRLKNADQYVPMIWTPLYLGKDQSRLQTIKDVLEDHSISSRAAWNFSGVVNCRSAHDLAPEFVAVLARWMRLQEMPIAKGARAFFVPEETQAFAIAVITEKPVEALAMVQGQETLVLSGRGDVWAGVGSKDGEWLFSGKTPHIKSGKIYLRPRYEWLLFVPQTVTQQGAGKDRLTLRLYLYSLTEDRPVPVGKVFKGLPDSLPAKIQLPGGNKISLMLQKSADELADDPVAFKTDFDFSGVRRGKLLVTVDLAPLQSAGIPVTTTKLQQSVDLRPSLRFVLKDQENNQTSLHIRDYPMHQKYMKKVLGD
jgi:hypothetical protein